ncbi:tudor domain-containing protein 6-like [Culicoides brevitarsis]|uniref:tudor domain-containing protein 6-like n=1 Tax=Culicoides brevitarsis TaxID=469753 RepID=UPI00307CC63B
MRENWAWKNNSFTPADDDSDDSDDALSYISGRTKKYRKQRQDQSTSRSNSLSDDEYDALQFETRSRRRSRKLSMPSFLPIKFESPKQEKAPESQSEEEPLEPALPGIKINLLPVPVARTKSEIPHALVFDSMFDQEFQIGITQIFSPYKFWFFLHLQNPTFSQLSNEMQDFYDTCDKSVFRMVSSDVKKDNVAVLHSNNTYKRVVIMYDLHELKLPFVNNRTKVFAIDYGEAVEANIQDLLYMKKSFAEIPRLSYRGRMALVMPLETTQWKSKDTKNFKKLCRNENKEASILSAKVYAFEEREMIFHLMLTKKEEDRCNGSIRKILASLNCCELAEADTEIWPIKDELYPTFDLLESGEANDIVFDSESVQYLSQEYKKLKLYNCYVYPENAN